jgi:hypothetical protein
MFLPKKKFRAKISSNNQDDTKENKFNKPKQQIPPMKVSEMNKNIFY